MITQDGDAVLVQRGRTLMRIEPWGADSVRVRIAPYGRIVDVDWDLLEPRPSESIADVTDDKGFITNGGLRVECDATGTVRFYHAGAQSPFLEERRWDRVLKAADGDSVRAELDFGCAADEHIYGMGQHPNNLLDLKGAFIDLAQKNTRVSIPFYISSKRYGFLWNNPAVGRVCFGTNGTKWTANRTKQVDYLVTTGATYAEIMGHYADATGHAPELPQWASGFWQCKLRYETQEELMAVAREYKRRGLPISVIVSDYFHWTCMGDWKFDPVAWPDPEGMVNELKSMGIELMVSIWPHVNTKSENFASMKADGLLVETERGLDGVLEFEDTGSTDFVSLHVYDPTNPEARRRHWEIVRKHYHDKGIRVFWLDACEPELSVRDHANLRYYLGNGEEIGCLYPLKHEQAYFEGLKSAGENEIVTLCRSAWVGSQRYGAALWSGDIASTFPVLREQVKAGLNVACSGLPWWTTDIGGFAGGDPDDPAFRELLVRWFQYGAFCPLFRLHGMRSPATNKTGGPNEVWSYGEEAYSILCDFLNLRERLRPYIMTQMRVAAESGLPPMRPLFFDFQDDAEAYTVDDAFMFGPDLLVAPVLTAGAVEREVYLPAGCEWTNAWSGAVVTGGQAVSVDAPLERLPLFTREGARLPIRDDRK